ncbi:gluconokinase [Aliiglaciecola sp. 3_MG-2023]|uniref:gluconokinase n=1 Tax=Aliiglaciecola sp. 3_MG-2023 TaxID=3062644 RepID=UPI0026E3737F|nr:gluconokinase [Aliiglaciecola sp. 3_MG-2023]MDO6692270.1 gluconokinase [Aliiglaciecola sp. 3_MG-2023]
MIVIVCGVCGTGKSTIGNQLALELDLPFFDADDFHPQSNLQKMKNGSPLNDSDRQPWLENLSLNLANWENKGGAVLACSGLKESYRQTLQGKCSGEVKWIVLNGPRALLLERLKDRRGHFFDPNLLDSQLETFELPDYGYWVDITQRPDEIVASLSQRLQK